MLRVLAIVGAIIGMGGAAHASCVGSSTLSSCYDYQTGNSYSTQRLGNMSTTYGSNSRTGSTWSQTDHSYGNSTYSTGRAANGNTWNSTTQNLGGGFTSQTGIDSRGRSFNRTCGPFGCN